MSTSFQSSNMATVTSYESALFDSKIVKVTFILLKNSVRKILKKFPPYNNLLLDTKHVKYTTQLRQT